jgi:hypothetical protein
VFRQKSSAFYSAVAGQPMITIFGADNPEFKVPLKIIGYDIPRSSREMLVGKEFVFELLT